MPYSNIPHPMTEKTPASLLFCSEIRVELTSIKLKASENSSNVKEIKKAYQTRMRPYHDCKHRTKLDMVKYVIMEFLGRDTYKLIRTIYSKVSGRNAKFLTRACPTIMTQSFYYLPDRVRTCFLFL